MTNHTTTISTPGRICLFGEHQDYLGLPVIAAAISCRIQVTAQCTLGREVWLNLPNIGTQTQFPLTALPVAYTAGRDYFRSSVNVLHRVGFRFSGGITGEVTGTIPINAGTSSSSALIVTWLNVLTRLADEPQVLSAERLAELAYQAEVLEFGEPGGMMDHYATAVGHQIRLDTHPTLTVKTLRPTLGAFVLGNSGEPKDTIGILRRVKVGMLDILARLRAVDPTFSLHTVSMDELANFRSLLSLDEQVLLAGNVANRDILHQADALLHANSVDDQAFGKFLTDHHHHLRHALRISTPKIDRMLDAALLAGALGGKINGSGGGGCMFAYAPHEPARVAQAIEQAGGVATVVQITDGTRLD